MGDPLLISTCQCHVVWLIGALCDYFICCGPWTFVFRSKGRPEFPNSKGEYGLPYSYRLRVPLIFVSSLLDWTIPKGFEQICKPTRHPALRIFATQAESRHSELIYANLHFLIIRRCASIRCAFCSRPYPFPVVQNVVSTSHTWNPWPPCRKSARPWKSSVSILDL